MIIGLSGLAGSGKDFISDILVHRHNFVKVAFADPLKRICKEIFDFSDEQLFGASRSRNIPDKRYERGLQTFTYPECPVDSIWVPLLNNRGFTLIDLDDWKKVSKYRWTLNKKEKGKHTNYARASINGKKTSLHTFVFHDCHTEMIIDHINGDGLDNRKSNLRTCSDSENKRNQKKRIDGVSVFKGVGFSKRHNKWRAFIRVNDKLKTIGYFDSEGEAALAYDGAARYYFDKYARLNGSLFLTPRFALQQLGTNWGRNCYPLIWSNYAFRVINQLLSGGYRYDSKKGLYEDVSATPPRGVVISDARFKNEMDLIKNQGGRIVRIIGIEATTLNGNAALHPSEVEQQSLPDSYFDYICHNDKNIEKLSSKLDEMLDKLAS